MCLESNGMGRSKVIKLLEDKVSQGITTYSGRFIYI